MMTTGRPSCQSPTTDDAKIAGPPPDEVDEINAEVKQRPLGAAVCGEAAHFDNTYRVKFGRMSTSK
jgi:hypothetical protein